MKTSLLTLLVTFLSVCFAFGGQESYVNRLEGNSLAVNATFNTYDSHYWDMVGNANWHTLFTNHKVSNYVRLGIRPDFVHVGNFTANIQVRIDYQTWGSSGLSTLGTPIIQTLTVDHDANGNTTISDLQTITFSNAHFVKVTILSMSGTAGFNKEYVYLETGIDIERYYAFNNQTVVSSTIAPLSTNGLQISWNVVPGAEFYELEYVHINKYTLTNGSYKPTNTLKYDFYLNSTRVDVTNTYYQLPRIFDKGYFLYRVRAVAKKGSNFSERDNGVWNVAENGTVSSLMAAYPTNYLDITTEYQTQMNWSHQVVFTEGSKRTEGVSFSDGLGRGRQSTALNPENGQVVVSNIYYDELGRPAVGDIPTPVSGDFMHHFPNFNRADIPGTPGYQHQYFDLNEGSCPVNSRGFSPNFGAGKYYSSTNAAQDGPNGMIPNAETFPFSRVTYLNDFTGRVDRVAAAGPDLKMGSGKETQYVYSSPNQEELNALFGVEAGHYSHYEKRTTIDPNGQVYVQYLDMAGRVVASYIEGDSPVNLTAVEDNTIVQTPIWLLSPGGNQDLDLTIPSAEITISQYISSPGDYAFRYGFTPAQYQSTCLPSGICFDCIYDLELKIMDECSNVVYENTIRVNGETFDAICNGDAFDTLSVDLMLTKQTYRISKKLSVNQASIDEYWCQYLENNTCVSPLSTIFNTYYNAEPFNSCYPLIPEPEEEQGPCDGYRQAMLDDLTPGGQYAKYILNGATYSSTDPWSVFTIPNAYSQVNAVNWQNPPLNGQYLDENGQNVTSTVTTQGLDYFINNFRPEWAELFLPVHPEYCHLEFCISNSGSNNFDGAMMEIIEYDAAMDGNYFEPLEEITNINGFARSTCKDFQTDLENHTAALDPFFSNPANAAYKTEMNAAMQNYITISGTPWGGADVSLSMWQYVFYLVNNCSPNMSPVSCIDKCDACKNDQIWLTFRDLYLELKSRYVMMAREAYAHASCPASACIGVNPTTCTGNNALLAGKIPNFVNTLMYASITGAANPAGVYSEMVQQNCQTSCETFADEWIADLSGCNFVAEGVNLVSLKADLINLCMAGCTDEHPMGGSTAPSGPHLTINDVLSAHLGSGFETSLCTDLLISSPPPHDAITPEAGEIIQAKLDTCGCNYYFDQEQAYQHAITLGTVPAGVDNLEEWIAHFTGVFMDDVDQILCECSKRRTGNVWNPGANAALNATGLLAGATISCDKGVSCIDCSQLDAAIHVMIAQFGDVTNLEELQQSSTYQTVLTNYFNRTYGFRLAAQDYMDFISRCHATPANPYCVDNPLLTEWILQTNVLAMRGQLTTSITNLDLKVHNIVYEKGQLRNNGQGNILNSSLSGNTLALTYTGTGYTSCNFQLTLPPGAAFGFNDLVSFEDFEVTATGCGEHTGFTCKVAYYECGIKKYAELTGTSSCLAAKSCYCSSSAQTLCYDPFEIPYTACFQPQLNQAIASAFADYDQMVQETYTQFVASYKTNCSAAFLTEHAAFAGGFTQYQYTLFYYDQAGNLARTVAPEGVHKLPAANNAAINAARNGVVSSTAYPTVNATTKPVHDYVTTYHYNSYNQLVKTTNPDQRSASSIALLGETRFWYDRYGRLVASQNPVQAAKNKYSYVLFDKQGRPVQSGQVVKAQPPNETTQLKLNDYGAAFTAWVSSGTRSEVTTTRYDKALSPAIPAKFAAGTQDNLRLRVASVLYFATVSGTTNWSSGYESAIHYSYDIHGNVKEQIQDVPMLATVGQTNKSTQYEYELVSGNVKTVFYQKDKADQVTHSYKYDKLNRLREASTSTDRVHSDRHAKYYYYDHGPMARVELGQNKVQSMDYVYTINGWIKGMNASTLDNTRDVGKDGGFGYFNANNQQHLEHAADVSGYTLGYFANDYKAIAAGSGFEANYSTGSFGAGSPGLFNGNIRSLVTSIVGMPAMGSVYKYDQLNRLLSMDAYYNTAGLAASNNWTAGTLSQDYKSTYSYDRNGNLKTLMRNGAGATQLAMDNLTYNGYNTAPGGIPWNRLGYVTDAVGATANYEDIDSQSPGNYGYDALGQLISDAAEGISLITWRSGDKKVQKIERNNTKPNAPQMEFIYNPFGQRVLKIEKPRISNVIQPANTWKYTYYSYDANGQVLAVYNLVLGTTIQKADLDELHLYGASRLGMIEHPVPLWNNGVVPYSRSSLLTHKSGEMRYEITNYLGNVNVVVNDRKVVSPNFRQNTFTNNTNAWSAWAATLTIGPNRLQVTPSSTANYIANTFPTTSGKRYILRVKTEKGSGSEMKVALSGVAGSTTLVNDRQNTLSFIAGAGTSTTVTISRVTAGTAIYYLDHVELAEDHIYDATVKMSSDYYPFGMQMPGRNSNSGNYRYGFTGKESDSEVSGNGNSYNFGVRNYDPRLARWKSLDPMKSMYPDMSPYCYAGNTPIAAKDPDGNLIIFVNGFTGGVFGQIVPSQRSNPGLAYWGSTSKFFLRNIRGAKEFFGDRNVNENVSFVDGSHGGFGGSTAAERFLLGVAYATEHLEEIKAALKSPDEAINFVTHSMGSAYSEGMISYLRSQGLKVNTVVHLSACDAADIAVVIDESITRYQLNVDQDNTLFSSVRGADRLSFGKKRMMDGVYRYGEIRADENAFYKKSTEAHNGMDYHALTKTYHVWKAMNELKNAKATKTGTSTYTASDGSLREFHIFGVEGIGLFEWNAFKLNTGWFMKSTGEKENKEFRSIDLDAHTHKPCNVGDW